MGSIGLAASLGTTLLVDLTDQMGSPKARTLADIAAEGPRLAEVRPGRRGVAVIRSGLLPQAEVDLVVDMMALRWHGVVVLLGSGEWAGAVVPLRPLFPGWLAPTTTETSVWQRVPGGSSPPGPGPILPLLRSGAVRRMLAGGMPATGRWLRGWRTVWEMPWG